MKTAISRLMTLLSVSLLAALLSPLAQPAGADQVGPSGIPLYDTMWELPSLSTPEEAEIYFRYLASRGYDGAWVSLFSGPARSPQQPNANGHLGFTILPDGTFDVNDDYLTDTRALLDIAQLYGLKVTVAPIWGNAHIHQNGACLGVNQGVLNAASAFSVGQQVAAALADHPAIDRWLYGGDNWCAQGTPEDVNIWRNVDAGIIAGGGGAIPVGYHAPNGGDTWFKDEPWLDFHAIQTSHCTQDFELAAEFAFHLSQTSKPIWAAEMRYEAMEPTFCNRPGDPGPGNPVTPQNVVNDTTEAFNAGLGGIVYGHNERWQYGAGVHGSTGLGFESVTSSFDAPGEVAVLALFGLTPHCNGRPVTVDMRTGEVPTAGDDVILGTSGADYIEALGGADEVCAGPGNDVVHGGPGDDALWGETGSDQLFGDDGIDSIFGNDGPDFISGGPGANNLHGGRGDDQVHGGPDGDNITGGRGFDQLFGYAGDDWIAGEEFAGVELPEGEADYLWGGTGVDVLVGNAGDDWLEGGEEGEQMYGGAGNDIVLGHGGDDRLDGGAGLDYLWGGSGLDTYFGGDDRDTLDGNDGGENVGETMSGDGGDDIILGHGGNDTLNGDGGSDYLWGGSGVDAFNGGSGPDYLDGNDDGENAGEAMSGDGGDDQVIGWGGDDTLSGGADHDYLWGGDGADVLDGDDGTDLCVDPQGSTFGASCEFTTTS